jgi:predicted  nucleic acid-binding Zn-ribbon protein
MTSAADLLALQEIDLRRDTRRALIADIEARLGETEEMIAAREQVAAAEADVEKLQAQQRLLEDTSSDLDAKIQPLEKKLYDGSIRNPKELTDLQRELQSLRARRSSLDDEGLKLMESLEGASAAAAEAERRLEETTVSWQAEQADLVASKARAQSEASELEAARDLRTRGMDAPALGLYENLRRLKQGRGVARIERGSCQGCRLTLPTHLVQRVRTGGTLVQCPSCERILVAG